MAGRFKHVVDDDLTFRGIDLLDNLGDAHEALEEMYDMLMYLSKRSKRRLHEAWLRGHMARHAVSPKRLKDPELSFHRYWHEKE